MLHPSNELPSRDPERSSLFVTFNQLVRDRPDIIDPTIPELQEVGEPITSPLTHEVPDLLPGLLPKQGQLVIAGPTDIGKSLVALEICSALTKGKPLWGEIHPTQSVDRIVYILGEHYPNVIKRLFAKTKLPMTDNVWLLGPDALKQDKWLVSGGKQNLEAIQKLCKWCEGADLIVFDPLAAFFVGTESENDNAGMRVVLDTLGIIAQTVGASCLILAHKGKPQLGKDGTEYSRTKYAIRGASSVEDAATNIFYMDNLQGGSGAASGADAARLFSMHKRKYKGDAPDEYKLLRDRDNLTHTILGNRPFIEARRSEVLQRYARLQASFPDMRAAEAMKMLSIVEGVHINTIRNYLGATLE